MVMQRRHFELIAEALRASRPEPDADEERWTQWKLTVAEFCGRLSVTNGLFNRSRFREACGVEQWQ